MSACEVNFDGLVGPTHNYAGLAQGNLHSKANRYRISHPRAAALQGLEKMRMMLNLGLPQGFIPPQTRPNIDILRKLGFFGSDREILFQAAAEDFDMFLTACSASSMWVANAATVTPSFDSNDGLIHLTPANLMSHKHRSYEATQTYEFLKQIFTGSSFIVHPPLLNEDQRDEGAANHMRLCMSHASPGLHVFVYGEEDSQLTGEGIGRQTLAASQAVAKRHGLGSRQTVFVQQSQEAMRRGVFHNDVIAMSNENVLIYHSEAYSNSDAALTEIVDKFFDLTGNQLQCIELSDRDISLDCAVKTYLFNSQIVRNDDAGMIMICPEEARVPEAQLAINKILNSGNLIKDVRYVPVRESMLNGGGPACLRLRLVVSESELLGINSNYLLDASRLGHLESWVRHHYRETLTIEDLGSYELFEESRSALEELMTMINKGFTHV